MKSESTWLMNGWKWILPRNCHKGETGPIAQSIARLLYENAFAPDSHRHNPVTTISHRFGELDRCSSAVFRAYHRRGDRFRWDPTTHKARSLSSTSFGFCGFRLPTRWVSCAKLLIDHTAAQEPHERAGIHPAADRRSTI